MAINDVIRQEKRVYLFLETLVFLVVSLPATSLFFLGITEKTVAFATLLCLLTFLSVTYLFKPLFEKTNKLFTVKKLHALKLKNSLVAREKIYCGELCAH